METATASEKTRSNPYLVLVDWVRQPGSSLRHREFGIDHSDLHAIFFQCCNKSTMEDGEGRLITFKNTIVLLTNIGFGLIPNLCKTPSSNPILKALPRR